MRNTNKDVEKEDCKPVNMNGNNAEFEKPNSTGPR